MGKIIVTTVAIMQPYFFPYAGYYQLVAAVDIFVFLDDVNFRKNSYLNRNYVVDKTGNPVRITLPVSKQSSNRKINEHRYADPGDKPIKTLIQCYGKDHQKCRYHTVIEQIIRESSDSNVAETNAKSIKILLDNLKVDTKYCVASQIDPDTESKGQSRIVSLCEKLGASRYVNLPGGRQLYTADAFQKSGIQLSFLETATKALTTASGESWHPSFIHHLSTESDAELSRTLLQRSISDAEIDD